MTNLLERYLIRLENHRKSENYIHIHNNEYQRKSNDVQKQHNSVLNLNLNQGRYQKFKFNGNLGEIFFCQNYLPLFINYKRNKKY